MRIDHTEDYRTLRAAHYPPLMDLADALYHQSEGRPEKLAEYLAACDAVKKKFPKPEGLV